MNRRSVIRILVGAAAALAVAFWVLAMVAGPGLGARFGGTILRAGQGKISEPAAFVSGRLREAGFLTAAALIVALCYMGLRRAMGGRGHAWAGLALALFAGLNLWLLAAMQTAAFWALFATGGGSSVLTQFQFKKLLLPEHRAPRQMLLLGSSQTQAQLDENQLNETFNRRVWVTELHFPGSHGLDLLLVLRRLRGAPGDDLVCYLSEYYFYSGLYSTTPPYFFRAQDFALLKSLGWGRELLTQPFAMGLLGQAMPLFAFRDPLAHRLLGSAVASMEQRRYDAVVETNLIRRAESAAEAFRLDVNAALQKAAFDEFVREAGRQGRRLILLEGRVNPLLTKHIPEAVRKDFHEYLRKIAAENAHVRLAPAGHLPPNDETDYSDLTHVTHAAQSEFSKWFASYYDEHFAAAKSVPAASP